MTQRPRSGTSSPPPRWRRHPAGSTRHRQARPCRPNRLRVDEADLFEAPPVVESSDIFSSGSSRLPKSPEGSDVISATSGGPGAPGKADAPDRASDIAITFDLPPGGSTIDSGDGSGELPVADEVPSDSSLFNSPQYGGTPEPTQDSSSILSDLSDPGDITINDSSAIRLESPGVGRTHHPSSGTEFDLTIGEGEIPPELLEAAEAAEAGDLRRPKRPASDPDTRTVPEINVDEGRVRPIDARLRPDDPSSIFDSINDPVVFRRPGDTQPTEDDAAVEFSDHPDDKNKESSSSSSLFGPTKPPGRKRSIRPLSEADFQLPAEPAEPDDSGVLDWQANEVEPPADSSNILLRGGKPVEQRTEPVPDPTSPTRPAPASGRSKAARPLTGDAGQETGWVEFGGSGLGGRFLDRGARGPDRLARTHAGAANREATTHVCSSQERRAHRRVHRRGSCRRRLHRHLSLGRGPQQETHHRSARAERRREPAGRRSRSGRNPPDLPPAATVPGQARLFAKLQQLGKVNAAAAAPDDAELRRAREELNSVANNAEAIKTEKGEWDAVQATIFLGVSHEVAKERDAGPQGLRGGDEEIPEVRGQVPGRDRSARRHRGPPRRRVAATHPGRGRTSRARGGAAPGRTARQAGARGRRFLLEGGQACRRESVRRSRSRRSISRRPRTSSRPSLRRGAG